MDPLGDAFSRIRSPETRRKEGATYTQPRIVQAMLAWAARQEQPTRVVDPGTGSARFLLRAARRFPAAELVGVELDPLAALMARANLAASGFRDRAEIRVEDSGKLQRELVLHELGGRRIVVIEPTAQPFPDAATTAAITAFEIAARPTSVYLQRVESLGRGALYSQLPPGTFQPCSLQHLVISPVAWAHVRPSPTPRKLSMHLE